TCSRRSSAAPPAARVPTRIRWWSRARTARCWSMVAWTPTPCASSSTGARCPMATTATTTPPRAWSLLTSAASPRWARTSNGTGGGSRWWTWTARVSTSCCCSGCTSNRWAMADSARPAPPQASARALLAMLSVGPPDDVVTLRSMMEGLGGSLFGMLLFIATLPAFLPIPGVAGALSGPLVSLIGLQLLVFMRQPWLPRMIADRGPRRGTLARFEHRVSPWLKRLGRVVRPRLPGLIDHPAASVFTGFLLLLLGVLLALPIPFTNYVFGVLLLAHAL